MKVTKKILSVFLAMLMAMSCCVAAFPTIANAALSGDDVSKLNQILQYAINNREITQWSATQSGTTKTITDNSTHGVIFDAAKYIRAVANTKIKTGDNEYANYHAELQDAVINATSYASNGNVQNLIRAVLQGEGQSEYHHRNDKSSRYLIADRSGVPENTSFTTIVKRNVTQAYLSIEYASLEEVPANVATTRTLQVPLRRRSGDRNWTGAKRYWLAFSGQMSISETTSASNVQALKNYKNYFTSAKIGEDLTGKSYAELTAQKATNNSYRSSVSGFASSIFTKYFTSPTKAQIDTYINNVAMWADRAFIREAYGRIQSLMAATPVNSTENSATLRKASADVAAELATITSRYSSSHQAWSWAVSSIGFNKTAIDQYISDTLYKASKIDITAQKNILDPVIAANPTADDIAAMDTEQLKADRNTVKSAYESANAINSTDGKNAYAAVFSSGDQYVIDWLNLTFTELDTRDLAADAEMRDSIIEAFPRPFIDDVDFSAMATDDIYNNHLNPGKAAYKALSDQYSAAAIANVFGQDYVDAIAAYLARAEAELTDRFVEDAGYVQFFYTEAGNKVGLGNYQSIIDAYENEAEWQIYTTPYITVTGDLTAKKNEADRIYNLALAVRNNMWTTDTSNWVERVIDWPAREARDADLARSPALKETYFTSEEKVQSTLDVIDEFLLSDDFGTLLGLEDDEGNPLDLTGTVQDLLQKELFTNEMITTIVNAIFPMLDEAIWNAVQDNAKVDLGFLGELSFRDDAQRSVYQSLEKIDLYMHPRKLAARLNSLYGSRYDAVENFLNQTPSGYEYGQDHWWNLPGGQLPEDIDWGVTDKESFLTALGAAFCGFTPLLRSVLGNTPLDGEITATFNLLIDIDFNLDLHADAVNGYNNAIAPLFEAIGVGGQYLPSVAEVNACTSSDQLIKTAIGPIFTWLEEEVMSQPVETIAEMLPNLVYNLNIGNVIKWLQTLKTNINLSGILGLLDLDIAIDLYEMAIKDMLGGNNLASLNDVLAFVKTMSEDLAGLNITLTQDEEAALAACGVLRNDLPSATSTGRRLGVEANGAKVFASLVMWVFRNVDTLMGALGAFGMELELPEEVAPILDNLQANPEEAFAALIELFQPQTYTVNNYDWWQRNDENDPGSIPGASAAAYVYLKYGNDWSYEKANMLYERIDDILSMFLKDELEKAGYTDAGEWANDQIQNMFDNDAITSVVRLLTSLSGMTADETISFIISRFAGGMDFGIWGEEYGYLFVTDADREDPDFVEPLKPGDAGYAEQNNKLDLLTVRPNPDRTEAQIEAGKEEYIWTYNGVDLENDNREQFAAILGYLLKELTPALDIFLSGKDGTLFDALTIKGYNGYDSAIIPLLEAFGVPAELIKSQAEFDQLANADEKLQYLINLAFDYVDSVSGENLAKILMVDVLPSLLYFIQSNGLSTLLLNLLKPVLVLLDTARPIFDLDINGLVGTLLNDALGESLPEGTVIAFDIKDLSLHALAPLGEALTGLDLSALVYGVDAICSVDNQKVSSESAACGYERYTFVEGIGEGGDSNKNDPANTITVLFSLVLDLLMTEGNAQVLDEMLFNGEKQVVEQLTAALRSADIDPGVYRSIDWFYFDELYAADQEKPTLTDYDGSDIEMPLRTNFYIRYANDLGMNPDNLWSEELAAFLDQSLSELADLLISSSTEYATLGEYLRSVWQDGGAIYTEKTISSVAEAIRAIIPEEVAAFEDLIEVFLEVDMTYWDSYDSESASEEPMSREQFAKELAAVFTPLDGILSWLLTGKDYKFFYNKNDGQDQIVLAGANGYETCIIPILEALGCNLPALADGDTAVTVLEKTINAALTRVDELLSADKPVDAILDILPNLIYFLNANGLSVSVINLFAPVIGLVEAVAPAILGDEYEAADVETLLDELTGLPVSHLDLMSILDIVKQELGLNIADAVTMTITDEATGESFAYNYLENFYVGELTPYRSANGSWAFRMGFSDDQSVREGRADLITILIYTVFDVFNYEENKAVLVDLLGDEALYNGIQNLLRTQVSQYEGFDWFYFDDSLTAADFTDGAAKPVDPAKTTMAYLLDSYLQYDDENIWNEETAEMFRENFYKLADMIVAAVAEDGSQTAAEFIQNLWGGANLYSKKNVYAVGKLVGEAITGIDENIRSLLGLVLDIDLTAWDEYINTEITAENDELYTKDVFAEELVKVFAPFGKILDWLLVGENEAISLFFLSDNTDAISIGGANGFEEGLVPILEALGCEVEYNADPIIGTFTGEDALEVTVNALLDRVEGIVNSENPVEQVIALLPNLIYFINANGLSAGVLNLLAALTNVLDHVAELTGEDSDLNALLGLDEMGIDIYDLTLPGICNVIYALTGGLDIIHAVSLPAVDAEGNMVTDSDGNLVFEPSFLESFAIGEIVPFTSANGDIAYRMQYSDDPAALDALDMFTILVCAALDVFKYPGNEAFFAETFGEEKYAAILSLLNTSMDPDAYAKFDWFYYDYTVTADSFAQTNPQTVDPAKTTMAYLLDSYLQYSDDNLWNEGMANAFRASFYDIVDMIVAAIAEDGSTTASEYIGKLWSGAELYSKKNVYAVGKLIGEAIQGLDETLQTAVGVVLGVDASAWDVYINTEITDENNEIYDRATFINELLNIFTPFAKILDWILVGENRSLKIFYGKDGSNAIEIGGGNGFEEGIIPILEAFGCEVPAFDPETIDSMEALRITIDCLLGKVDAIAASDDAVEQIVAMMPNLIYFINANGLSVSVRNLIAPLVSLLENVAVLTGEDYSDLNALFGLDEMGIDIYNLDFVGICHIVAGLVDGLDILHAVSLPAEDAEGNPVYLPDGTAVYQPSYLETLAIGEVEQYTSANGNTAYRMQVSDDPASLDMTDMFTILVCSVLDVFLFPENEEFFKELLGADQYDAIVALMNTTVDTYFQYDWFYFDRDLTADAFADGAAVPVDPSNTTMDYLLDSYLQYNEDNLWSENTAEMFRENFYALADMIVAAVAEDGSQTAAEFIQNLWGGANLYSKKNVYAVGKLVGEAITGIDENIRDLLGMALDIDLSAWDEYINTEITDENDKLYTKDVFAEELVKVFAPFGKILDWLLVGENEAIELFYLKDGSAAISIGGANGFEEGLVPILEALGCEVVYNADPIIGSFNGEDALEVTVNAFLDRVESIVNSENPVEQVIAMLPNLIYFINANGLSVSVMNLLAGVTNILDRVAPLTGDSETDLNELLGLQEMGIDIYDLTLTGVFDIVYALTDGLDITHAVSLPATDEEGNYLYDDNGEMIFEASYLETLAIGEVSQVVSANGHIAYRMDLSDDPASLDMLDMFTILVCSALDVLKYPGNAAFFEETFGADVYQAILSLMNTTVDPETYSKFDWFYFDPAVSSESFPADGATVTVSYDKSTMGYLQYNNIWNEDTATYIRENFYDIVDTIIKAATGGSANGGYDTAAAFLKDTWNGVELYSKKNVYAVGKLIGEAIQGLDETLQTAVGVVLGVDASAWDVYINTEITDENNEIYDRATFINELLNIFTPFAKILDWILVGENRSLKIFYGKDGSNAIEIGGGNGFEEGIIPILEAFGCEVPAFDPETIDSMEALRITIDCLLGKVDAIAASDDAVEQIVAMMPNLIYFINANGLSVSVRNLIAPLVSLLENVAVLTGEDYSDLNTLFGLDEMGIDLYDLDLVSVFNIVKELTGIEVNDAVTYEGVNLYETFAIGEVERFTSANGRTAYRMHYSDDPTALDGIDMLTILVSTILSVFTYDANEEALSGLLGEETFTAINAVLSLKKDDKYLNYRWLFTKNNYTEIADEWVDQPVSPLQGITDNFDYSYDEYWTREKANEVAGHLNDFIAELAKLLGIEINGIDIGSVGDLVTSLVGETLYTQKNINAIASKLNELLAKIDEVDADGHIKEVVKRALGVDLTVYEQYNGSTDWGFADGDRQGFTDALVTLLRPLLPVLKWVLLNEDMAIFNDLDGSDKIVLPGGNGYVEGIIPILEALDRDSASIVSPAQYYRDAALNEDTILTNILNPLFDFVDYVLADPLNRIFEVLPGVIYFINSKGLDTSFKNLLHPVYQVLTAIEPMVEVDLYELIGFDLETMDFEKLYSMLLDRLGDMGMTLKPLVGSALKELTIGRMVKFTSRTGDTAFTMEYDNDDSALASKADMLTIILRLALKWLTMEENRDVIRTWIRENTSAEDSEYVIALYDTFAEYTSKPHGINMILGALYYVYYGVDVGVEETLDWFDDTNGKWKFIMQLFGQADSDYLSTIANTLDRIFDFTEDVIDEDGVASSGLIPFFQKIINWFKSIIQWIKDLFAGIS